MSKLKIFFLSMLLWVLLSSATAKAQEDVASQVVSYCEENVINGDTIQWSLEAIINCLFFNPETNNNYEYEAYIVLSEEKKYIEKSKLVIDYVEMIKIKHVIETDKQIIQWTIYFRDKSIIRGELTSSDVIISMHYDIDLENLPVLENNIYIENGKVSATINLREFNENYSEELLFDLYYLYRSRLRHEVFDKIYLI